MSEAKWIGLLIIAIIGLGIILPILIRQRIVRDSVWTRYISLGTLILVATVAAAVGDILLHTDPGAIFTRAFLIDGISVYVLNNAPLQTTTKRAKE